MQVTGLDKLREMLDRRIALAMETHSKTVEVGFSAPYGVYVHENLEARHHPPYGTGGQAKFLEQPARERHNELAAVITQAIKAGQTPLQAQMLAGLMLQGWAQELCPVDTGMLRNSAYTVIVDRGTA